MHLWKSLAQRDVLIETAERIRRLEESDSALEGLSGLRHWLGGLGATQREAGKSGPVAVGREEFGQIQAQVLELLMELAAPDHPSGSSRSAFVEIDRRLKGLGV